MYRMNHIKVNNDGNTFVGRSRGIIGSNAQ